MGAQSLLAQKPIAPSPAVDFQRVVRPILSDNCFHCHGPDANTRMVDLRLDTREGAFAKRENGVPVVPGNLQASLVYQRITQADPARRMPPESSHKVLTDAQKDILKRWIADGAPWKEHWSFVAPSRAALPAVRKKDWVRESDRSLRSRQAGSRRAGAGARSGSPDTHSPPFSGSYRIAADAD